jgi:hypothetical protein
MPQRMEGERCEVRHRGLILAVVVRWSPQTEPVAAPDLRGDKR